MITEFIKYSYFAMGVVGVAATHIFISEIRSRGFNENYENLKKLHDYKQDIFYSDKKVFLDLMLQKKLDLLNDYSLHSAEYSSRLKALGDYEKFHEGLQDMSFNAVNDIHSQAINEIKKSTEFWNKNFLIPVTVASVMAGSVLVMHAVHQLSGKTIMELLSDTIDQVGVGAKTVAQTIGGAMELASETMDRWLAGANDHSEYEAELDGAAPDVAGAGADYPVFIEDALLADGAVPALIGYPHTIAL